MTRRPAGIAFAALLLLASQASVWAFERPEIHFDSRVWKVGYQVAKGNQTTVEFVLENETVDNWSELVTTQLFSGLDQKTTVEEYVDAVHKSIQDHCPSVKWNSIRSDSRDAVYEWSVQGCSGVADQSEIARVIRGAEGIHVLHYATRRAAMPDDKRKEWLGLLDEARLLT